MFSYVFAQTQTVTGKVTDDKGAAIAGASVLEKGTKNGTSTSSDGTFSLTVKKGAVLIIQEIGFQTKTEKAIDGISIQLSATTENLNDVVVTALGQSQKKAKVGYATTTINSATLNKNAPIDIVDGLAGKIAGADISSLGGPGSSSKVVLRSYGVIAGGNNAPLYVIDGVPLANSQYQQSTGGSDGADYGNGANNINPNDVESVTFLLGTAATSLYGGLAKNGAVIITTKKGKAGKLKIDFNSSVNFSQVGKLPTYQSEFGQGWGGIWVPDENGSWGPKLDGQMRLWGSVVDNSQLEKPFSFVNNNLRKFYNIGQEYNNSLALSGGNQTTNFYFSYGNVTSNGIIPADANKLERNTFALRTNSVFDKFYINTSLNFIAQSLSVPNTGQGTSSGGGVFQSLLQIPVDLPIKDFADYKNKYFDYNNYWNAYAENPYYGLNENGNKQSLNRLLGNLNIGYNIDSHWNVDFKLGGDFTNARTFEWKQMNQIKPNSWRGGGNPEGSVATSDVGEVYQGSDYYELINGDLIVKYNNKLNQDFNLSALAGANYYETYQRSESAEVTNLLIPSFFNLSNTTKVPTVGDAAYHRVREGLYLQATLEYKDQLFLTGNIRNDWSSTLPLSKNAIFYPGANLSWLASQNFKSDILSYLKLRVAYGRTGSDPNLYLVYPELGSGNVGLGFGSLTFPFNGVSGYGINNTIGNTNLKPIFTNEAEVGFESKFFNNRIGIDLALYDKKTKGQIFTVPIAPSTGYTGLVENLGTVSNKGIELTATFKPIATKNFSWNIVYTYTKNWNKVENLTGSQQNPLLFSAYSAQERAVVGKTVASIYAPVPQKSPDGKIVVNALTGMPQQNTDSLDKYGNQYGYYGSGLYNYTMGLSNTFTYKNFQLSFSFDFRYGGVMYSQTADLVLFVGNGIATTYNDRKPFIVPNSVNTITDANGNITGYVPNTTVVGSTQNSATNNINASSTKAGNAGTFNQTDNFYQYFYPTTNPGTSYQQRIFDRSFLKLRDVNLSYSLPNKYAKKIKATNLSVGVYGRNFLIWVPKSNVYVDPEATNFGNDITGLLGEFSAAPISHQFGAFLKVSF